MSEKIYDPSADQKTFYYTLDNIADRYNDIMDVKSVSDICKLQYPMKLFGTEQKQVQLLGILSVDIKAKRKFDLSFYEQPPKLIKKYGILFINLYDKPKDISHSNVALFNREAKIVERFEPHGADPTNKHQRPCGFMNFYDASVLDLYLPSILKQYCSTCTYIPPLDRYPVFIQSLSTNDGTYNKNPSQTVFKRKNNDDSTGDSFCGAWTTYYVMLRILNPYKTRLNIYSYLFGPDEETRGRYAADRISYFINYTYNKYQNVLKQECVQKTLEVMNAYEK